MWTIMFHILVSYYRIPSCALLLDNVMDIAQMQHVLRALKGDGDLLKLAVCRLYIPSQLWYMRATKDIMIATLQGTREPQPVLAVDILSLTPNQ